MKTFIRTILLATGLAGLITFSGVAQEQDTVKKKEVKFKKEVSITLTKKDSTGTREASKGRFVGGITFTRLDLGFTKLVDNGSFTLSPENDFLDYRGSKSTTLSFDMIHMGYRFNPNFKIYVAGGFDWTHIRLNKDITIQKDQPQLSYIEEDIHFSKNRFSSSYMHFPLNFELRTKEDKKGRRLYFVVGPEVSFLLNGKVKQISEERGKEKFKDDYRFQTLRYAGTVRFGHGNVGLFTKYYFNDMFASKPQAGLTNMVIGVTAWVN